MERNTFINLLRNASFLIGNSSTGLLEAPIIPLGVVNVGERQRGRLAGDNVIFVDQGIENIERGIEKVKSIEFQQVLANTLSPYGNGDSIERAYRLIKTLNFNDFFYKTEDPLSL